MIGLDPTLVDFAQPGYPLGMTTAKFLAGIKSSEGESTRLGYNVQTCSHDFGETAEAVVANQAPIILRRGLRITIEDQVNSDSTVMGEALLEQTRPTLSVRMDLPDKLIALINRASFVGPLED